MDYGLFGCLNLFVYHIIHALRFCCSCLVFQVSSFKLVVKPPKNCACFPGCEAFPFQFFPNPLHWRQQVLLSLYNNIKILPYVLHNHLKVMEMRYKLLRNMICSLIPSDFILQILIELPVEFFQVVFDICIINNYHISRDSAFCIIGKPVKPIFAIFIPHFMGQQAFQLLVGIFLEGQCTLQIRDNFTGTHLAIPQNPFQVRLKLTEIFDYFLGMLYLHLFLFWKLQE